jgi:predicted DNA-binding protein (UPF0251 family)
MEIIKLGHDNLEALHLCDGLGKNQDEAGVCMGVSRGTVQRLLASARHKVALALAGQKALSISGGGITNLSPLSKGDILKNSQLN